MMVRLGFAVAAHLNPEILLIDEVLAVGDAAFQKKCIGKMEDVSASGRTILFVSHNLGAINALCPTAIYFDEGKLQASGLSKKITREYLGDSVAVGKNSLDLLRDPGYGSELRFRKIDLVTGDGKIVEFEEDLVFSLVISSSRDINGLSIGASVFSFDGLCIGTLITRDEFSIAKGNTISITLKIGDLSLAPGSYHMGFSVGHGGLTSARKDFDVLIGLPAFRIVPTTEEGSPIFGWNSSWGNLVFRKTSISILEETQ
jgi:lipopolysaccharide transport system ATP-binding protein